MLLINKFTKDPRMQRGSFIFLTTHYLTNLQYIGKM